MRRAEFMVLLSVVWLGAACAPEFQAMPPPQSDRTFGEKFFTISCQRVAYTSTLKSHAKDPQRATDVSGSYYRQACKYGPDYSPKDAKNRDPKVAALVSHHDPMVKAVDLIFPGKELSDLQDYMVSILPLTDNDKFPAVIRKGAAALRKMETDKALHYSLAHLDGREGYRPRKVCLGLVRELVSYPKLHEMLNALLGLIAEGGKGHRAFLDFMAAVSFELQTMVGVQQQNPPVPVNAPDRTLKLTLELLFSRDPKFSSTGNKPLMLARRDWRGIAHVLAKPGTKTLPRPFVDGNLDGLADLDKLGKFLTSSPNLRAPAPFHLDASKKDHAQKRDSMGRATDNTGIPIYRYIDLDATLLAALSRDALKIMDPKKHTGTNLLLGLTALMGDRKTLTKKYATGASITYNGFDTAKAPLLDLLHATLQVLGDPNIDGTLEGADLLLKNHEAATARLIEAAFDVKDLSKLSKYDGAKIKPTSKLYDELIPVVAKIANKDGGKLLEDLLVSLGDPRAGNLGGMLANYMTYSDVHLLDQKSLKVHNKGAKGALPVFKVKVDRSKSDSGHNRSIQQRLTHIIRDTHHMKMCNKNNACIGLKLAPGKDLCLWKFKECELFEVKNGALFYMQSIARLRDSKGKLTNTPKGHLRLKTENMNTFLAGIIKTVGPDTVLKMLTGIDGMSTHPTTNAINRLMFMDPLPPMLALVQDPAVDVDGHVIPKAHIGSLMSWEVPHPQFSCSANDPCHFYAALRPVVQAFADHDSEGLFLDLLAVLHRHWSSPNSSNYQYAKPAAKDYSAGSNITSYEPLVAEITGRTDFMPALSALGPILQKLKLSSGKYMRQSLVKTVAYVVDPTLSPGLKYRDGRTQSKTTDGKLTVPGGVSPFYLFADAFAAKNAALSKMASKDKVVADAWNSSTSELIDVFLDVQGTGYQSSFKNRRVIPAGSVLVDFIRARIKAHRASGDMAYWLGTDLPRALEQKLGGPVVARLADFLRIVEGAAAVKSSIYGLIGHLVNEVKNNASFQSTVAGLADMLQLLLDDTDLVPVMRALGKVTDPQLAMIATTLRFLRPAIQKDTRRSLSGILKNAVNEQTPGKSPMQTLLDVAVELHRQQPGAGTSYTGADFAEAFKQAREFLEDQETGLVKFFDIVKNRCGGPCASGK